MQSLFLSWSDIVNQKKNKIFNYARFYVANYFILGKIIMQDKWYTY